MNESSTVETTGAKIRIERVLDAPRELVFRAWTDPEQVVRWWGPEGFDTPPDSVAIELRPGGRYHLDMVQGSTGTVFPLRYEIVEIAEPDLIVLRSAPKPELGLPFEVITRVELHDVEGRTRMVLIDGPYPEGGHAEAGWNMSFDKLERALV